MHFVTKYSQTKPRTRADSLMQPKQRKRNRDLLLGMLRSRARWEDNIKMDLQEVGCGGGDWIGLAQNRDRWRALVSAVMKFRVP